jgi:MFS superfamily sulfate permease-like transporter
VLYFLLGSSRLLSLGPESTTALLTATAIGPLAAGDPLDSLREELTARGIVLALARVKQDLRDDLQAVGFLDRLGPHRLFYTLPTVVEAFHHESTPDPLTLQLPSATTPPNKQPTR